MLKPCRSENRSLELHREIVKRLQVEPELWNIPLQNIDRWQKQDGGLKQSHLVWKTILTTLPHEEIIKLLLSKSQRSTQLRSCTPFVGIIDPETRNKIFEKYKQH